MAFSARRARHLPPTGQNPANRSSYPLSVVIIESHGCRQEKSAADQSLMRTINLPQLIQLTSISTIRDICHIPGTALTASNFDSFYPIPLPDAGRLARFKL
ncbi:hypothetical protein KCP74_21880 [Salmonella enterica subsp. enterica]|nr:hypothetical protein KCP74_21880 [Salmonella enterica subsp. enterica]